MQLRLLLVDDEKAFTESLSERLRARDFHVETADSGEAALEKLKQFNFDVVILDVRMPGMGGIAALKGIKELKPLTEVLMLTGHGTVETAIEGMKLGAYDFLMKPCEMEVLLEKIKGAHERKWKHEERIRKALADELSTSPLSVFE